MIDHRGDGVPNPLDKPGELALRVVRIVREAEEGSNPDGMGRLQALLAGFKESGTLLRSAFESIVADEGNDHVDRLIAAAMSFNMYGTSSSAADRLFLRCLVPENERLYECFLGLFAPTGSVPPVTVERLEEYLAGGDAQLQLYAALLLKRPESIVILGRIIRSGPPELKLMAASSLARMPAAPDMPLQQAAEHLVSCLEDDTYGWGWRSSVAFVIGQFGSRAEPVLPRLGRLLMDSAAPPGFRQHVVRAIREIARNAADRESAARELVRALDMSDPGLILIAVDGLSQLRFATKRSVRALVRLLDHEDAGIRSAAIERIGEYGHRAGEAVRPLISLWDRETDAEVLYAIMRSLENIGRAALDPLFERMESGNPKEIMLPLSILHGMKGVGIEEILKRMLTHPEFELGMAVAMIMRLGGHHVEAMMPTFKDLLESDNPRWQLNAAVALSGARREALPAAPELANALGRSTEPLLLQWAASALRWIGPDARAEILRVLPEATAQATPYLLELREQLGTPAAPAADSPLPDLTWFRNRDYLRLFRTVGEILRQRGACSHKELAEILRMRLKPEDRQGKLSPSERKIGLAIAHIEEQLTAKTGHEVRLIDRKPRQKGRLTPEGEAFLSDVIIFLNYIDLS